MPVACGISIDVCANPNLCALAARFSLFCKSGFILTACKSVYGGKRGRIPRGANRSRSIRMRMHPPQPPQSAFPAGASHSARAVAAACVHNIRQSIEAVQPQPQPTKTPAEKRVASQRELCFFMRRQNTGYFLIHPYQTGISVASVLASMSAIKMGMLALPSSAPSFCPPRSMPRANAP